MPSPSRKFWMVLPLLSTRSPLAQRQSPASDASADSPPIPTIPPSNFVKQSELEKTDGELKRCTRSRSRTLSSTAVPSASSSPELDAQDMTLTENVFDFSLPLHQPSPRHPTPNFDPSQTYHPLYRYILPPRVDPGTPPLPPSPIDAFRPSPTLSLVPTEIASRSPSPQPHPCMEQAQASGVKVRDFAFEKHNVELAPTIPDVDQLKGRYDLYRSAGLTPPEEVVDGLKYWDQEWLATAEKRYEAELKRPKPNILARTRETQRYSPEDLGKSISADEVLSEAASVVHGITANFAAVDLGS